MNDSMLRHLSDPSLVSTGERYRRRKVLLTKIVCHVKSDFAIAQGIYLRVVGPIDNFNDTRANILHHLADTLKTLFSASNVALERKCTICCCVPVLAEKFPHQFIRLVGESFASNFYKKRVRIYVGPAKGIIV